jgi:hypothetical protein
MRSLLTVSIVTTACVLFAGCGNESKQEESGSSEQGIADIKESQSLSNGTFAVVCKNNTSEIRTTADIQNGNVCNSGNQNGNGGQREVFANIPNGLQMGCLRMVNPGMAFNGFRRPDGKVIKMEGSWHRSSEDCERALSPVYSNPRHTISFICQDQDSTGSGSKLIGFDRNDVLNTGSSSIFAKKYVFGNYESKEQCKRAMETSFVNGSTFFFCGSSQIGGSNRSFSINNMTLTGTAFVGPSQPSFDACLTELRNKNR